MKRANGTGTIFKKKGNRRKPYFVYGGAYNENGKRVTPFVGSFATVKEAQTALEAYNHNPNILRQNLTFAEVYEDFKTTKRYEKLTDNSKRAYLTAYKNCAKLYNLQFSLLRTAHYQEIINGLENEGKAKSTMKLVQALFSVLNNYAMQEDICEKNYSQFVTMPDLEQKIKRRALTDIEIQKIKKSAYAGNEISQLFMFLLYSGWRITEALELTHFSYDPKEKTFTGGKKTKSGKNRVVPIHPQVQWIVDKFLAKNGETVFCIFSLKKATYGSISNNFAKLRKELNLPEEITFHFARHTFATKLKQNGAEEFYRKRLLGHSNGNITDDIYTHADLDNLRKAVLCFDKNNDKKLQKNG